MTLRTLNYGNYGIFLIMGNAGFCPSTVVVKEPAGPQNKLPGKNFVGRYSSTHERIACLAPAMHGVGGFSRVYVSLQLPA